MAFEDPFAVSDMIIAIGRQETKGTPRTANLTTVLVKSVEIDLTSDMADLQTEIGLATNTMQRKVKQVFKPQINITANLRAGALIENAICAAGYAPIATGTPPTSGAVATTVGGSGVVRNTNILPVAASTGVNIGDWVQVGVQAFNPPHQNDRAEVHAVSAVGSGQITLAENLMFGYPSGAAVATVQSNKAITKNLVHLKPSDSASGANDYWTVYVMVSNGTDTVKMLMFDGKTISLNPSFQMESIASVQTVMDFCDVTVDSTLTNAVTLVDDPSPVVIDNTSGSFIFDTDTINTFMQVSLALKVQHFLDVGLTQYKGVGQKPISHDLSITATGKFNLARWLKVNFGSGNNSPTPATTEVQFVYFGYSEINVPGDTVPYAVGLHAPTAQAFNYTAGGNGGDVLKSSVTINPVPDATSLGTDSWYFLISNGHTSGTMSAA